MEIWRRGARQGRRLADRILSFRLRPWRQFPVHYLLTGITPAMVADARSYQMVLERFLGEWSGWRVRMRLLLVAHNAWDQASGSCAERRASGVLAGQVVDTLGLARLALPRPARA